MAFSKPKYTQIPNDLLGDPIKDGGWKLGSMTEMSNAELRVTLVLARLTLGFHREQTRRSIRKIAQAAGIAPSTAQQGLRNAEARGTITRISGSGGVNSWILNLAGGVSESDTLVPKTGTLVSESDTPSMKESKKESITTSAPSAQTPEGDYFTVTEGPEYTDLENEISSPTRGPVASTPEQKRWLAACGHGNTLSFERGQKSRVKAILASVKRGDVMAAMQGDAMVYQQCLKELGSVNAASLKTAPSTLPRSWLEDRLENAKKYGWSRRELLNYTVKRDKMIDHCRKKLRTLDAAPAQESPEEYAARTGKVVYR